MHDRTHERRRSRPGSLLLGLLALGLGLGPGVSGPDARAGDGGEVVSFETAEQEIELLDDVLGSSRAVNDQILGALDAVAEALEHLPPPPTLVTVPIPDDAPEARRDELEDENERAERDWKKAKRRYDRKLEQIRDDAEDLLLDALRETKVKNDVNVRDAVNIRAAQLLATWGDPKVARKIQRILERDILDAKHDVPQRLLDAAFHALAGIGSERSLEWLVDEFTHTRSTPRRYVDQLLAAHQAMLAFPLERIPGDLRHEVVEQLLRSYAGVESQAGQSSTDPALVRAKMFWDRIGRGVVAVLQRYAGEPTNAQGVQLGTVQEFQAWFRDHKSPRDEVWQDVAQG